MAERSQQRRLPDLLRERRLERGLPEPAVAWTPMRPLLLRGSLIGGVALLASVGSVVVMQQLENQQQQQLQALAPFEQRVRSAEGRVRSAKQQAASFRKDNQKIV